MVEQNNNQQGSTLLIVVIALLVLVGAGLGGWYVLNHKDKDSKTAKDNASQQQAEDKKDAEHTPADPSEGGKYLVIKEWGVRFPLSEELRDDIEYGLFTPNTSNASNDQQIAYFSSKKIVAKPHFPNDPYGCGLHPDNEVGTGVSGGFIALSRSLVKLTDPDLPDQFKNGDYWYYLESSNGGECYPGDTGEEGSLFKSAVREGAEQLEPVYQ